MQETVMITIAPISVLLSDFDAIKFSVPAESTVEAEADRDVESERIPGSKEDDGKGKLERNPTKREGVRVRVACEVKEESGTDAELL